ncbi:SpdD-like protein [Streptomyces lasalocidi]|uniref:SpdD-like protein n=1 Tax=Streptomyces lasalocidi TaxID=324833 RepID=A0A4U5WH94_STRLS|nr:SpdD-like protein [Streptomyces lasalocidi]TKT01287.1 SpdD-like protein [Streptomyces lasalocidi]
MLRPKIPAMPTPTGLVTPPAVVESTAVVQHHRASAPAPIPAASTRPAVQLTPGTALALVGAGTAAVLVVGAVLVSMLLAVAVTGASVAVCAVVLRSLLAADAKRR